MNIEGCHDASYWHDTINRSQTCVGSMLSITFDIYKKILNL